MRATVFFAILLTGCGGKLSFYEYKYEQQFKCDMDPNRQQCTTPADIRKHTQPLSTYQ